MNNGFVLLGIVLIMIGGFGVLVFLKFILLMKKVNLFKEELYSIDTDAARYYFDMLFHDETSEKRKKKNIPEFKKKEPTRTAIDVVEAKAHKRILKKVRKNQKLEEPLWVYLDNDDDINGPPPGSFGGGLGSSNAMTSGFDGGGCDGGGGPC